MNLLVLSRMCLTCMKTVEAISDHCPQCGEPLVSCIAKLLSVNDKPVPKEPEVSDPNETSWPLESVLVRVERELKDGKGRKTCNCGHRLHVDDFRSYGHDGGVLVEGRGKQWLYLLCPDCGYAWSLWKLGIFFEAPGSWTISLGPIRPVTGSEPLVSEETISIPDYPKPFCKP